MGNTVPGEPGSGDLGVKSWIHQPLATKFNSLSLGVLFCKMGDNTAFLPQWLRRDTIPGIQYVLKSMKFYISLLSNSHYLRI